MGIEKFQEDLRNGMSLEEALKKHNISFKEAWDKCPKPMKHGKMVQKKYRKNIIQRADEHIQQRNDKYYIRKTVKGRFKSFGVYTSLKDAQTVRDFLIKHGWTKKNMEKACNRYKIKRRT